MDEKTKRHVDQSPAVERKGVYEFTNNSGNYSGLCLVVGGRHRRRDRYISIIQLKSVDVDGAFHNDEMGLRLPDGREFWVHCGMITYLRRDLLGKMVHKVSDQTMKRVNLGIMQELGLSQKTERIVCDGEPDYEKLYKDLIRTIANWNKMDEKPVKKHAVKKGECQEGE